MTKYRHLKERNNDERFQRYGSQENSAKFVLSKILIIFTQYLHWPLKMLIDVLELIAKSTYGLQILINLRERVAYLR